MIYKVNDKINKIYLGETAIQNVYLGNEKIWQSIPPILYLWNEDTGGDNKSVTGGWVGTKGLVFDAGLTYLTIPGYISSLNPENENSGTLQTKNKINFDGYTKLSIEYAGRNINTSRNTFVFESEHLPNSTINSEGLYERMINTQTINPNEIDTIGMLAVFQTPRSTTAFAAYKIWLHN